MSIIRHSFASGDVLHLWCRSRRACVPAGIVIRRAEQDVAVLAAPASADPIRQVFTMPEAGEYELTWDKSAILVSLAYGFNPGNGLDAGVVALWTTPDNALPDGPLFHFAPPWGWMNDPNGVCQIDGVFHLFYQHMPHMRRRYRTIMYWGHAISRDGVNWTHLPIFLGPRAEMLIDGSSAGGAYSGSAIADPEGGLRIYYTDREDARLPEREWQLTFRTKDGLQPSEAPRTIIEARPDLAGIKNDFRDPFVFRGPDGLWKMVLGSRSAEGGTVLLYETEDAAAADGWRFVGEIARFSEYGLGAAECPCLLPLGASNLWAMPVSLICHHRSTRRRNLSLVLIGRFDGRAFSIESVNELDYGPDCYAFQGNVSDGESFGIAWAGNWSDITRETDSLTTMTLPRRLEWRGDHLATPPHVDTSDLRGFIEAEFEDGVPISLPFGTAEIELEIAPGAGIVTIDFGAPADALHFVVAETSMSLQTTKAPEDNTPIYRVEARPRLLRIFIDIGIVEIYADEGRWCFTKRLDWTPMSTIEVNGVAYLRESQAWSLCSPPHFVAIPPQENQHG